MLVEPRWRVKVVELRPVTLSLNAAVTGVGAVFVPGATPVAPAAGLTVVTVGRGPVVNVHTRSAKTFPAASLILVRVAV